IVPTNLIKWSRYLNGTKHLVYHYLGGTQANLPELVITDLIYKTLF
uniref:Uncharacterized protein n=1 Tax=Ditylenchus dipsaci TaxID=166011 RepID=A0A915CTH6_9BILA